MIRTTSGLRKFVTSTQFRLGGYEQGRQISQLTKERYPIQRGNFAEITDRDVGYMESIIGSKNVLSDPDTITSYNTDFMEAVRGSSKVVLRPKTTVEVSEILKYCNERKLAVCPQGGNTGLVGGSVPVFDEIILSTSRMNQIESIDELSGVLVCQSGCILEQLDETLMAKGLRMPLDLGAKGSCHIGGNISTNAGGIRLIRFGNLHGSVLGVEAVKADGTILNLISNCKKDNTGYHLKHLFIGSEGTLGIVTRCSIFCPAMSSAVNVALLGLKSYGDILKTYLAAKRDLGEILSSCEMLDNSALESSSTQYNLQVPIANDFPFYMLIETSGSNNEHDEAKLNQFLTSAMENGLIEDGTATNDTLKMRHIWQLRELVASSNLREGYCFKYDISLPLLNFYDIVTEMRKRVGHLAKRINGYGHIGDSNMHLNITCAEWTPEIYRLIEPYVYEFTANLNGSISAEHGIGFLKTKYLRYSKDREAMLLMKQLKLMMDPNGILNPYKVLPDEI